jgi:hypothetical protein
MLIGQTYDADTGQFNADKHTQGSVEDHGKWGAANNKERKEKVYQWLMANGPASKDEIIKGLPWADSKVKHAIEKAYDEGAILEPQTGEYRAT